MASSPGGNPWESPWSQPYLSDATFVVQARVNFHGCLKLHVYFRQKKNKNKKICTSMVVGKSVIYIYMNE